ncbi:hypothetical protein V8B97DRAFT_1042176 [Scleroderma yunnanense]
MSGLVLQLGIMVHSFVVGLTLAIISGSEFGTCLLCHLLVQCYGPRSPPCVLSTSPPDTVAFHQFLKASRSVFLHRISPVTLPLWARNYPTYHHIIQLKSHPEAAFIISQEKYLTRLIAVLKPTPVFLFAITTPAGTWLEMPKRVLISASSHVHYLQRHDHLHSLSRGLEAL